ncbi:MAG: hypothetical protein ACN4GZ_10700, partial [Acidimicrobiales bacterium]
MEAADIIAATPAPADKDAVLSSLGALLESIDLESSELVEHEERCANFEQQLASLSEQRDQVSQFADAQERNEPISLCLVGTFEFLIADDDLSLEVRNDRLLGLFRSASACIMVADWPDTNPSTVDWVESFNRVVERKIRDLRINASGYSKVVKIKFGQELLIPTAIFNQPHYDKAPKEYWLQYASFSLIGSVLGSRKPSAQLR